jgi:hypothetical protein
LPQHNQNSPTGSYKQEVDVNELEKNQNNLVKFNNQYYEMPTNAKIN